MRVHELMWWCNRLLADWLHTFSCFLLTANMRVMKQTLWSPQGEYLCSSVGSGSSTGQTGREEGRREDRACDWSSDLLHKSVFQQVSPDGSLSSWEKKCLSYWKKNEKLQTELLLFCLILFLDGETRQCSCVSTATWSVCTSSSELMITN